VVKCEYLVVFKSITTDKGGGFLSYIKKTIWAAVNSVGYKYYGGQAQDIPMD